MRALIAAGALLVGCSTAGAKGDPGPAGPQGPKGDTGAQGAPGSSAAGGGAHWVDAVGQIVGSEPEVIDDAGVWWRLDLETAQPVALSVGGLGGLMAYDGPNCSGRQVMITGGVGASVALRYGDTVVARDATTPAEMVIVGGYATLDGGCTPASGDPYAAVPWSTVRAVTPPTTGFIGPLRRAR